MNGFCFIVHVFCMEQKKKNTHTGRAETLCALTWVRARKHWPLDQQAVLSRSQSRVNKKEKKRKGGGGVLTARSGKKFASAAFYFIISATKRSTMLLLGWFDDGKSPELTFWPFTNSQAERFNCHVWWRPTGRTLMTSLRLGVLQPAAPPDQSQCNS